MQTSKKLLIKNITECDKTTPEYSFLKTAIFNAFELYIKESNCEKIGIQVSYNLENSEQASSASRIVAKKDNAVQWCTKNGVTPVCLVQEQEDETQKREQQYVAQIPFYSFDRLVVPDSLREKLSHAINLFKHHDLIYNIWGLKSNSPFPVVALNFWGPAGTGKTLAAHAIAAKLNRKIILASYAQIESMYHGEGPKNVEAIFKAAESQNAVLFIDEADSLLSRRLTNVQHGSENAINSMRSQILICLEKFNGIVIFATNLVTNYDKAFESRVRNIEFKLPDYECRKEIWKKHLPVTFPQDPSLSIDDLAQIDDVCGREIRNAVQMVAEKMADEQISYATLELFSNAVNSIKESRIKSSEIKTKKVELTDAEKKDLTEAVKEVEAKHKSEKCSDS